MDILKFLKDFKLIIITLILCVIPFLIVSFVDVPRWADVLLFPGVPIVVIAGMLLMYARGNK